MRWVVVAVLSCTWAWAGMTTSTVGQPVRGALGVAVAVSVLLAWWAGRRSGRAVGIAVASARAEARAASASVSSSTSQVVVNVGEAVARRKEFASLDDVPWVGGPAPLIELQDAGYEIDSDGVAVEDQQSA